MFHNVSDIDLDNCECELHTYLTIIYFSNPAQFTNNIIVGVATAVPRSKCALGSQFRRDLSGVNLRMNIMKLNNVPPGAKLGGI